MNLLKKFFACLGFEDKRESILSINRKFFEAIGRLNDKDRAKFLKRRV